MEQMDPRLVASVTEERGSKCLLARRIAFCSVDATTSEPYEGGSTLTLSTKDELEFKEYDSLPPVPTVLTEIVPFSSMTGEDEVAFPDYRRFLDSVGVLHVDVLIPFLSVLKHHLSEIQIYLGYIDAWLLQPSQTLAFLNSTFDAGIELPTDVQGCDADNCDREHDGMRCIKCYKFVHDLYGYRPFESYTCDVPGGGNHQYYHPTETTLTSYSFGGGQIRKSFLVHEVRGQQTLLRFLEFVKAADS